MTYTYYTCTRDPYSASVSGVSQVHRRMDFGFPRVKYPVQVYSVIITIVIIIIIMMMIIIIIIIIRIFLVAACATKGLMVDKISLIAFRAYQHSIPLAHVSKLNRKYTQRLHGRRTLFFLSLSISLYLFFTKTSSALPPKKVYVYCTYTFYSYIHYFPPKLFVLL